MITLAVILAGGEGRRMGGGKPLRRFGRTTLIGRALDLAHGYAERVAVAVRDPGQLPACDAPLILDMPGVEGPLGGLAAALAYGREIDAECVLTLPCDMPDPPADLARRLAAALIAQSSARAAMAASEGQPHPVCALWRIEARDRLPAYLASSRRSLRGFAEACGAVTVAWPTSARDAFANANTPAELAALQPVIAA